MKKKVIISVAVLVIIAVVALRLTVFSGSKNEEITFKKEAIDRGNIQALVITTGTLNPVTIVDVGSQVSGKIEELYVDFNSEVEAGQIIAEIEKSSFLTRVKQNEANYQSRKASLEKSKITLANNEKKYKRALELFEKDLISFEEKEAAETQYFSSKADLQSSEASLQQAESTLETSNVDLSYTIIKSPINGVVINRNINIGQTVAASFQAPVLFQIANNLDKMQVECNVDEADIGKIKEGQRVKFTVDAFPDENFTGVVSQVRYSPAVVQNVVTYATIVEVANPELKLRPGMTATASIVTGEATNALRVVNAALRFNPDLSPEEMRKIFEDMRQGMGGGRDRQAHPGGSSEGRDPGRQMGQRPGGERQGMGMRGTGGMGSRMRQFSRVWIEDENGKLKMIFVRTGVTDNTYTEIVSGNLKEGQEVITGETSSSVSSRRSSDMGRMMRMMR